VAQEQKALSDELVKLAMERLYVPVVCDVLDRMGIRVHAMHQRLRPLDGDNCRFIGPARTMHCITMEYIDDSDPYGVELEACDSLKPGDVVVHSTDFQGSNAPWGELMSTAATMRGAVGCVCDSQVRDCKRIMELGFPVFATGIKPVDSMGRGRVIAYDVPILCGGITVHAGDIIFADYDGVAVIPRSVAREAFETAVEKVDKENLSRQELLEGRLLGEVYAKYGVL